MATLIEFTLILIILASLGFLYMLKLMFIYVVTTMPNTFYKCGVVFSDALLVFDGCLLLTMQKMFINLF